MAPLRERLEAAYTDTFEQAAADIDRIEQFLYPQLRLIVSSLLPNYRSELLEVPAWPEGLTPSIAPLGDRVTMDLGVSWWGRWFATGLGSTLSETTAPSFGVLAEAAANRRAPTPHASNRATRVLAPGRA